MPLKIQNSMSIALNPREARANRLLEKLPAEDFERLLSSLEFVDLTLGEFLYQSGDEMKYLYFPTTAIVSLLYTMESGSTAEMGVVGRCGAVGIALFMGGNTTPNQAMVQIAGGAFRIKAKILQDEFNRGGAMQMLLLRYTQSLITHISQTAVCNRLHSIDQQLCRWLLLSHDRLDSDKLVMTHDLISNMLGVRREGVTLAAQKLARKKLITSVRGTMTVIDRKGLEHAVCECYKVVNDEYNRLLGRGISRTFG